MKRNAVKFAIYPLFVSAVLAGCSGAGKNAEAQKPNVVFIYADDIGIGDLGCYDGSAIETANVSRLADEGLRFTNAHSGAATSTQRSCNQYTCALCHAYRRICLEKKGNRYSKR